ncbi:MAG: hypothetical protein M1462_00130 [Candidatus Thermoplasmatota archaeon]|jgi:hypothetical protein|uniref:hypothetical protein n=1 Tax=Ferroplasma sp. TaxID=2591003 RepID=UPI002632F2DC|nr:hypothetical protein [Ferroplasma sp.]MCL4310828.1 hypothetical protein [Candidatus Thermoplasmatota archaeon]
MITDYYQNKLMQWQYNPAYRDYRDYVINNKDQLVQEFKNDMNKGFSEVCDFLHKYEQNQVRNATETILDEAFNPGEDVLNILVSATLVACNLPEAANSLIGLAVAGIISVGAIAILSSVFSKR